jgi:alkylation response protein AidB-like acyl-CoA dehydrogenase
VRSNGVVGLEIGPAQGATEISANYARIRRQTGTLIGTSRFSSIRCAEMATRAYGAKVQLFVNGGGIGMTAEHVLTVFKRRAQLFRGLRRRSGSWGRVC